MRNEYDWMRLLDQQVGKRVRFLGTTDPEEGLEVGMEGLVIESAEPLALLRVRWDNGKIISLLPGTDHWEVIEGDEMAQAQEDTGPVLPDLSEDMKANRFDQMTQALMELPQEELGRVLDAVTNLIGGVHSALAMLGRGETPPPRYGLTKEQFAIYTLGSWLLPALAFLVAPPGEVEGDFKPWQTMRQVEVDLEMAQLAMGGTLGEVEVWANNRYQVFKREYPDLNGGGSVLVHLSIKQNDKGSQHDWRDFQRIKNDVLGLGAEAMELYPAEHRLVDTSNQYHLWAFRDGAGEYVPLEFGLNTGRLVSNVAATGGRQRPFAPQDMPYGLMEKSHPLDEDGKIDLSAVIRDLKEKSR